MSLSKKQQRAILTAVNIGTTLEWYELSLYAYWAPTISKIFFSPDSSVSNLVNVFMFLALGYLIRPFGGIFFGWLGDRIGRKKALIWSILVMTIPTLLMSFLPSYSSVGYFAPILLCINRLLQTFPAGGELPGSFCYLYESAQENNRKYLTSWGFFGNQLGIALAMAECLIFEKLLSHEDLITWGWRLSFLLGGLIGFFGFYLRHTLKETPFWEYLEKTHKIVNDPIKKVLLAYKWQIAKGVCYSAIPSVSFGAVIFFFPYYLENVLGTNYAKNLVILILILVLITVLLPFFGRLADKYNYKRMMIYCSFSVLVLISLLYFVDLDGVFPIVICSLLAVSFSCLYAILPFILTDLFPTPLRFTGIGLTFNIADSFEGFTPVAALYLLNVDKTQSIYFWILITCTLISIISYFSIRKDGEQTNGVDV